MAITDLKQRPELEKGSKVEQAFLQLQKLLSELKSQDLPAATTNFVNAKVEEINGLSNSDKELRKKIKKEQSAILKRVEKDVKIVPKNYYQNLWLPLGMSAFGIPLGVTFGLSMGNMAFLGIGLPIGMAIGYAYGSALDKKAAEEGRQLDVKIKH